MRTPVAGSITSSYASGEDWPSTGPTSSRKAALVFPSLTYGWRYSAANRASLARSGGAACLVGPALMFRNANRANRRPLLNFRDLVRVADIRDPR